MQIQIQICVYVRACLFVCVCVCEYIHGLELGCGHSLPVDPVNFEIYSLRLCLEAMYSL